MFTTFQFARSMCASGAAGFKDNDSVNFVPGASCPEIHVVLFVGLFGSIPTEKV